MTFAVKLEINQTDLTKVFNGTKRIQDNHSDVLTPIGEVIETELRKTLLSRKDGSPKQDSAKRIQYRRLDKFKGAIFMPKKLIWYDGMNPHFVSLMTKGGRTKSGTNIVRWVKKYYGTKRISSKSSVWRGPRGGLKGFIWVTNHPFVSESLNRSRARFNGALKGVISKMWRGYKP